MTDDHAYQFAHKLNVMLYCLAATTFTIALLSVTGINREPITAVGFTFVAALAVTIARAERTDGFWRRHWQRIVTIETPPMDELPDQIDREASDP